MSGAPDESATEQATDKRKREARAKGDQPRSRDLAAALTTGAGVLWLALAGGGLVTALGAMLGGVLGGAGGGLADLRADVFVAPILPLAAVLIATLGGAVAAAALTGAVPHLGSAAPRWSRLDPLAGLGRLFGRAAFGEVLAAFLKTLLVGGVAAWTLHDATRTAAALAAADLRAAMAMARSELVRLVVMLSAALAVVGGVDLPWRVRQWLRRLRMTKQQLREESRESEGAPELRGALRRRMRDILNRNARAAIKTATVVLTNPTEFAVALRYERARDRAPIVVAKGRGDMARAIREMAAQRALPVLRQPELTRALYFTAKTGEVVREDLYIAVATVLAWVMNLDAQRVDLDAVTVPDEVRFDADGKREPA